MEASRVAAEACSGVLAVLGGGGGDADVGGGARGSLGEAAFLIRGLAGSAQRAANSAHVADGARGHDRDEEGGGSDSVGANESVLSDGDDDDDNGVAAAVKGLQEAISICREAEALAAGAQARVAEYALALRADPFRREECTTRLRELERLCRAIGVRTATQACAAAEVGGVYRTIT